MYNKITPFELFERDVSFRLVLQANEIQKLVQCVLHRMCVHGEEKKRQEVGTIRIRSESKFPQSKCEEAALVR